MMVCAALAVHAQKGVRINGVVWAERNVNTPGKFTESAEEYGMYYQWNRNEAWDATESAKGWNSAPADGKTFTKENDPCPAGWRVPTAKEIGKLLDTHKVESIHTTENGVYGQLFIDRKTGGSIFLPAAGGLNAYGISGPDGLSGIGCYWSATRSSATRGVSMVFNRTGMNPVTVQNLANGYSIRCVKR